MTPLFGPKPAPRGIAFGPGFGERWPGSGRLTEINGWPAAVWSDNRWSPGAAAGPHGWPEAPMDPYGQLAAGPRQSPAWPQWPWRSWR